MKFLIRFHQHVLVLQVPVAMTPDKKSFDKGKMFLSPDETILARYKKIPSIDRIFFQIEKNISSPANHISYPALALISVFLNLI